MWHAIMRPGLCSVPALPSFPAAPAACRMQHATCSMQHTCTTQHATCKIHAAYMQHTCLQHACNTHATYMHGTCMSATDDASVCYYDLLVDIHIKDILATDDGAANTLSPDLVPFAGILVITADSQSHNVGRTYLACALHVRCKRRVCIVVPAVGIPRVCCAYGGTVGHTPCK